MTDEKRKSSERRRRELLEALEAHVAAGDVKAVGDDLGYLGRIAEAQGQHKRAVLTFESALTAHRGVGDAAGAFLDLHSQGEALLGIQGQLGAAVAALKLAADLGERLGAPEAEQLEVRYEVVLRQLGDRFPQRAASLREALAVDPEAVRVDGVHDAMADPGLALAFFEDQLALARALEDLGGVFSCLGSQAQVLVDAGELDAAAAAFALADSVRGQLEASGATTAPLDPMLSEWRAGLIDAAGGEAAFEALLVKSSEAPESLRAQVVAKLLA